jgi:hypothetical protein
VGNDFGGFKQVVQVSFYFFQIVGAGANATYPTAFLTLDESRNAIFPGNVLRIINGISL